MGGLRGGKCLQSGWQCRDRAWETVGGGMPRRWQAKKVKGSSWTRTVGGMKGRERSEAVPRTPACLRRASSSVRWESAARSECRRWRRWRARAWVKTVWE